MVVTVPGVDYAAIAELLDLPEASTVEEQIHHLWERRAFQLETLGVRDPDFIPTATLIRLRASRLEEVRVCELALEQLGAPIEPDDQVEVVRVDGRMICATCSKPYRDHPDDPRRPWPSFVRLCDGTVGKT